MIGIICAEQEELNAIIKISENTKTVKFKSFEFILGKILNKECVFALSGCGKVNSAICTQTMIIIYNPKIILNVGVAGSIDKKTNINDLIIADGTIQYDYDVSAFADRKKGQVSGFEFIKFICDKNIVASLIKCSNEIKNIKTHVGTILTGDRFISSKEISDKLRNEFGGIACEMEAASIAQVCYLNNIPLGIIKSISDNADKTSHIDFPEFIKTASNNTAVLLKKFIELYRD
ncbi:MAG: 5'-methylthioadenosine/adenosylhomocysteine nucleosidase [Clostridia bacterium]|nr:5'-methylthioadenosine/adenosylhomocysteine nucleosidase [Clostridia bacterium]